MILMIKLISFCNHLTIAILISVPISTVNVCNLIKLSTSSSPLPSCMITTGCNGGSRGRSCYCCTFGSSSGSSSSGDSNGSSNSGSISSHISSRSSSISTISTSLSSPSWLWFTIIITNNLLILPVIIINESADNCGHHLHYCRRRCCHCHPYLCLRCSCQEHGSNLIQPMTARLWIGDEHDVIIPYLNVVNIFHLCDYHRDYYFVVMNTMIIINTIVLSPPPASLTTMINTTISTTAPTFTTITTSGGGKFFCRSSMMNLSKQKQRGLKVETISLWISGPPSPPPPPL